MRHFTTATFFAGLLAAATLGLRSGNAQGTSPFALEERIPADTILFLSAEEVGTWKERFAGTQLGRLCEEPEVKAFLEPLKTRVAQLLDEKPGELGEVPPIAWEVLEQISSLEGQVSLAVLDWKGMDQVPVVVTALDFGANAPRFLVFLSNLLSSLDPKGQAVEVSQHDGRPYFTLQTGGPVAITATFFDTALLLSTDADALKTVTAAPAPSSLAALPAFATPRAKIPAEDRAFCAYMSAAGVGKVLSQLPFPGDMFGPEGQLTKTFQAAGYSSVQSLTYGLGFAPGGFREALVLHVPGERHGYFGPDLLATGPWQGRLLPWVPARTIVYFESGPNDPPLKLEKILPILLAGFDESVADPFQKAVASLNEAMGQKLDSDLLAHLAGSAAIWLSLPDTGGLFPEAVMALEAKNPEALEASLGKLGQAGAGFLTEKTSLTAKMRSVTYRDQVLHLLELEGEGDDLFPFTPCWMRRGNWVFFALVPHTLKDLVLRDVTGAAPPEGGLAAQDDFQEVLRGRPEGTTNVTYVDLKGMASLLYDTAVPALQAALKPNMLPEELRILDMALLPSPRVVLPYFSSMGAYSVVDTETISYIVQSPVPLAGLYVALVAAAVGWAQTTMMAPGRRIDISTPGAPQEIPDAGTFRSAMAQVQARDLARQVRLYVVNQGNLPETLSALVEEEIAREVPMDPWGHPFHFVVQDEEAQSFQVVSAGPDGALGSADDIAVDG